MSQTNSDPCAIRVQELKLVVSWPEPPINYLVLDKLPAFWDRLAAAMAAVLPQGCCVTATGTHFFGMDTLEASMDLAEAEEAKREKALAGQAKSAATPTAVATVQRHHFGLTAYDFARLWEEGRSHRVFEIRAREGDGLVLVRTHFPTVADLDADRDAKPQVRLACRGRQISGHRFYTAELRLGDFISAFQAGDSHGTSTARGRLSRIVIQTPGVHIFETEEEARAWVGVPAVGS